LLVASVLRYDHSTNDLEITARCIRHRDRTPRYAARSAAPAGLVQPGDIDVVIGDPHQLATDVYRQIRRESD
jgi:hypothetical protein